MKIVQVCYPAGHTNENTRTLLGKAGNPEANSVTTLATGQATTAYFTY
jgi:hypothetical protein